MIKVLIVSLITQIYHWGLLYKLNQTLTEISVRLKEFRLLALVSSIK